MIASNERKVYGVDFIAMEPEDDNQKNLTIQLLPSKRKMVVHSVSFSDEPEPTLHFNYDVVDGGEELDDTLKQFLGDVIVTLLLEGIEKNEDRESNSQESSRK